MMQEDTNSTKNTQRKNDPLTVFYPILLAVAVCIGVYFGSGMQHIPAGSQKESVSKINNLLRMIEDNYVDEVDRAKLTEDAVRDILHGLDPHSAYMTPDDAKKAREELSGNFGGVGIQFLVFRDTLVVTHLVPNGPSEQAGLKKFDRIVDVDGVSMAGRKITTEDVFKSLRGDLETKVKLTVLRKSEKTPLTFTIIRDAIPVSTVETAVMLNENTGLIRLNQFGANTHSDFLTAVNRLQNRGMKNVILDLRDNGGGYLEEAKKIADEFLSAGKIIVYTEGAHSKKQIYKSTKRGRLEDAKVVVLINHNSASASEIVAGAIQDNDRGIILGRRSFGKGLVQQEMDPFNDGSSIRLTIARYYTPSGRSIQKPYGKGIDYEMEQLERYEHNEFFVPDSSIFVDSLKFVTPMGKVVYGGGGIMPDVFVPMDTSGRTDYYLQLIYNRIFAEFAFDFVEKNRKQLDRFSTELLFAREFVPYSGLIESLFDYAVTRGVKFNAERAKTSMELIIMQFKAEVARLLWNSDGFYSVFSRYDKDVLEALKQF